MPHLLEILGGLHPVLLNNKRTEWKGLQFGEVYTFPELVGQVLASGGFISTIAGAADSINMRVSGREIT